MNCSRELIAAYLDEELDAVQQTEVERHMTGCRSCADAYARLSGQKAEIRATAPHYRAPRELHASIRAGLRRVDAARPGRAQEMRWRGLAIAASVFLVVSVSWNAIEWRSRTAANDLAGTVLTDHIRSLIGTHLVDVPSSDQHTVKPWFAGKLDFSPDVKDLEAQGFPLVGGRVEYLEGRRVAALVYHRRQHVINLFVWPGGSSAEAAVSRNGYNVRHWAAGGMTYWAVSDVSATDLASFRNLFK